MSSTSGSDFSPSRPRRPSRPPASNDEAVAEIIGSILMVSMTVLISLGLVALLVFSDPGPNDPLHATVAMELDPGPDGDWATGNERVRLVHQGGEPIPLSTTRITLEIDGQAETFTDGTAPVLDHTDETAFDDGQMVIGEVWETPDRLLPVGREVHANLVTTQGDGAVAWTSSARAGTINCDTDVTAPIVQTWTQTPDDVTTSTTGDVTVRVTVLDACGNLDTSTNPHLEYRVNDGTDPAFTDTGEMTPQANDQWEATIPDQTWSTHVGEDLEYKVTGMADTEGNTGDSKVQTDTIQLVGSEAFLVAPLSMETGTITNPDNAQDDDDGDEVARITEEEIPGGSQTTDERASTSDGTAGTDHARARGSPDGVFASLDDDGEYVEVGGFTSSSGDITKVELVFKGQHDGGKDDNGVEDTVTLTHSAGATSLTDPLTTTNQEYTLDITSDAAWDWTAVEGLTATITCDCHDHPSDKRVFEIDAIWVRVTADATTYELETSAWGFEPLGSEPTQYLEIRYKAPGTETFALEANDGGGWSQIGTDLDSPTFETQIIPLTQAQVDAGPEVRIVDLGSDDGTQRYVQIDYIKVVGT